MRKKTVPRTRKPSQPASSENTGLIVEGKKPPQSARTESALDNRSHRTPGGCRTPRLHLRTSQQGARRSRGIRTPEPSIKLYDPAGKALRSRAATETFELSALRA